MWLVSPKVDSADVVRPVSNPEAFKALKLNSYNLCQII